MIFRITRLRDNAYEIYPFFLDLPGKLITSIPRDLRYLISADVELMSRLMEVQKIKTSYIPKTLVRMRVGGASNGSFKSIILQNFEVIRSFNANNIRYNLPLFVIKKLFNRFGQYIFALKKNKELK